MVIHSVQWHVYVPWGSSSSMLASKHGTRGKQLLIRVGSASPRCIALQFSRRRPDGRRWRRSVRADDFASGSKRQWKKRLIGGGESMTFADPTQVYNCTSPGRRECGVMTVSVTSSNSILWPALLVSRSSHRASAGKGRPMGLPRRLDSQGCR